MSLDFGGRHRQFALALAAFGVALIAMVWVSALERVRHERSEATADAIRQNTNLALAFEQHTLRTLKAVEHTLQHLSDDYEEAGGGLLKDPVRDSELDPTVFAFAAILGKRGEVVYATGRLGDAAAQDFGALERHRGSTSADLAIGTPVLHGASGKGVIPITRRIEGRDGAFAGVALVGLRQDYFGDFYDLVDLKRNGMAMLVGVDGMVLARRAGAAYSFGQRLTDSQMLENLRSNPAGDYVTRGRLDGKPRFLSYRAVQGFPLVVAVGTAVGDMLAEVEATQRNYLTAAALITVVILAFVGFVLVSARQQNRVTAAALEAQAYYRATFHQAPVAISHTTLEGRFLRVNERFCQLLGYSEQELLERSVFDVTHPDDQANAQNARALLGGIGKVPEYEKRFVDKAGNVVWTIAAPVLVRDRETRAEYVLNMAQDITERKRADARQVLHLRHQEKMTRFGQAALGKRERGELIEDAVQTILEAVAADAVAYVERAPGEREVVVRAIRGHAQAQFEAIACPEEDPVLDVLRSGARRFVQGTELAFRWAKALGRGALIPVGGERGTQGALCVFSATVDGCTTEEVNFVQAVASVLSTGLQRMESESRLAFLAQFDSLTGLPNRALLADRFSQMIMQAKRRASPLGVLFVDLDDFKLVNDTLGHAAGDELLKDTAARLQATVRAGDTVARISGDEFAILLADLTQPEDAGMVAQKVIAKLSEPIAIAGQEVFVSASIGIASYPADGENPEALLAAADAAMYRAKQAGRNTYQFFTAEINPRINARLQLTAELKRALEREEFELLYQPKFDLVNRRARGAEALLRWRHPERGLVSPAEFVPVLEQSGLIVPVGEWVLQRACRDLCEWRDAGGEPLPIAVNLSARQFRQQDLDKRIQAQLQSLGVPADLLELEITESQLMHDPEHARRIIHSLMADGIRIAIDDFGTGYSSLAYLTRFPVAALKVDRSFVADSLEDEADATIVRTIIEMAHNLRFTVIAEGVETEAQAVFLRGLGCDEAQGYLFARPMPVADLKALIARPAATAAVKSSRFGLRA